MKLGMVNKLTNITRSVCQALHRNLALFPSSLTSHKHQFYDVMRGFTRLIMKTMEVNLNFFRNQNLKLSIRKVKKVSLTLFIDL